MLLQYEKEWIALKDAERAREDPVQRLLLYIFRFQSKIDLIIILQFIKDWKGKTKNLSANR